jgi:hypothetical protein
MYIYNNSTAARDPPPSRFSKNLFYKPFFFAPRLCIVSIDQLPPNFEPARIEISPAVFYGRKTKYRTSSIDAPKISPAVFYGLKKKPRRYRTYSRRFRKEKRRFGNYHEVRLYFLLFVVKNIKKSLIFFLIGEKTVFTTPLIRNTLSTNISTNISNVGLPLAVTLQRNRWGTASGASHGNGGTAAHWGTQLPIC